MTDFWGLNFNYEDFDRLLRKEELEEEPVPIDVFVQDRKYLGLPPLSDVQTEIAKHITQIYKPHTLVQIVRCVSGKPRHERARRLLFRHDATWMLIVSQVLCHKYQVVLI